jgi:WD40 repeat protein
MEKTVRRYDLRTGQPVGVPLLHADFVRVVAVTSDGQRLVTGGSGPLMVWDITGGRPPLRFPAESSGAVALLLAADDTSLFTYQGTPLFARRWNLITKEFSEAADYFSSMFSSPRRTILGSIRAQDAQLLLRNGVNNADDWLKPTAFRPSSAAVSADDRLLAVGSSDGGVRFYDLRTRRAHAQLRWQSREITRLAFSPDGSTLAVASREGTIHLVGTPCRHEPEILHPRLAPLGPLACSPDGRTLAVADCDGTMKLLDTSTGRVFRVLPGELRGIDDLTFSWDGGMLAALSAGAVFLWDTTTGERLPFASPGQGRSLAFAPQSALLAVGCQDDRIYLWNAASARSPGTIRAHTGPVRALTFAPDGRTLASSGDDSRVCLWRFTDGRVPEKPLVEHSLGERAYALAFFPDGITLATGGDRHLVRIWQADAASLKEIRAPLKLAGTPFRFIVSASASTLVTEVPGETPLEWDLDTLTVRRHLPSLPGSSPEYRLCRPARGPFLAVYDGETATVERWDPVAWKADHFPDQGLRPIDSLAFTSDGRSLITGADARIRVVRAEASIFGQKVITDTRLLRDAGTAVREWNSADGSERSTLGGPAVMAPPSRITLSSDDRFLAAGGEDGTVFVWDRIDHALHGRLFAGPEAEHYVPAVELARRFGTNPHYPESVHSLAFCPGSHLLVTLSSRGALIVWDADLGRPIRRATVELDRTAWIGFSPSGDLVIADGGVLEFTDPRSGAVRFTLDAKAESPIATVAFSRDGSLLAVAGHNRQIHLLDRQSGQEMGRLIGHMDRVNALAFTPDSRILASGSSDRTVKLWDVRVVQELISLEHQGKVTCLAFNSDGTILATAGENPFGRGEVYLWRAPAELQRGENR